MLGSCFRHQPIARCDRATVRAWSQLRSGHPLIGLQSHRVSRLSGSSVRRAKPCQGRPASCFSPQPIATGLAAGAASSRSATTENDTAMIARGRYLAQVAGCNDCHTAGYLMGNGQIPESQWLTGDSFGWRGPWGTTYAPNLRLFLKDMSEDQWVQVARTLKRRPPMPWYTLNKMQDATCVPFIVSSAHWASQANRLPPMSLPDQEPSTPCSLHPPGRGHRDELFHPACSGLLPLRTPEAQRGGRRGSEVQCLRLRFG
jgi:mono/diheme cytochrome c family protein